MSKVVTYLGQVLLEVRLPELWIRVQTHVEHVLRVTLHRLGPRQVLLSFDRELLLQLLYPCVLLLDALNQPRIAGSEVD